MLELAEHRDPQLLPGEPIPKVAQHLNNSGLFRVGSSTAAAAASDRRLDTRSSERGRGLVAMSPFEVAIISRSAA